MPNLEYSDIFANSSGEEIYFNVYLKNHDTRELDKDRSSSGSLLITPQSNKDLFCFFLSGKPCI